MKGWGVFCIIMGVGSFILPMMGYQFKLLSIFGEAAPIVGGALAVLGVILLVVGAKTDQGE